MFSAALTSVRPPAGRNDKCISGGDVSLTSDQHSPKLCGEQKTDKSFIVSLQFSVSSAVRRLRVDWSPMGSNQDGAGLGAFNTTEGQTLTTL